MRVVSVEKKGKRGVTKTHKANIDHGRGAQVPLMHKDSDFVSVVEVAPYDGNEGQLVHCQKHVNACLSA